MFDLWVGVTVGQLKESRKDRKRNGAETPGALPIPVLSFILGKLNKGATC